MKFVVHYLVCLGLSRSEIVYKKFTIFNQNPNRQFMER